MTTREVVGRRTKVMTVLGTRPEIIRLSRVMPLLDLHTDHVIVHTGQNYDDALSAVFFRELELREPDHVLDLDTRSLGSVLGGILIEIERMLLREQPDVVLILGDTNSSIAGVMAKRMRIPVFHMEAGNRCFDANVPEEINRRLIDHIADVNLAYTEHARRNLLAEGLHPQRVYVTGSPLPEVLHHFRDRIESSDVLERLELQQGQYFLVSLHREENVDNKSSLSRLMSALEALHAEYGLPVVVSTHPRTRKRKAAMLQESDPATDAIRFLDPFGYLDYCNLQLHARCTLSDSGTISEESAILSFPAVTLRNSTERPEAMDTGTMVVTGLEPNVILGAVQVVIDQWNQGARPEVPTEYRVANCAQRVVNLIVGIGHLIPSWSGLLTEDPFWLSTERTTIVDTKQREPI